MRLILARHGNTFGPNDKVVWVGARSDLPLVDKGRRQATAIAQALMAAHDVPERIYAGPLQRTRQSGEIVASACGLGADALIVSDALREIDYGTWEGRSNDEIRAAHGDRDIDDWQQRSLWPDGHGWTPGETAILTAWTDLIARIEAETAPDGTALVISSNGIFRVVAKAWGMSAERAKMATGALSRVTLNNGHPTVTAWNLRPADPVA